jgi:hypothetical protein
MIKVKSLQELTGYESGVIVYKGGVAFATNWSWIDGLPVQFLGGVIGTEEELEFSKINEAPKEIMEIAFALAEQEHKDSGDEEKPIIDEIFENEDCYIFTFDGWN